MYKFEEKQKEPATLNSGRNHNVWRYQGQESTNLNTGRPDTILPNHLKIHTTIHNTSHLTFKHITTSNRREGVICLLPL